MKDKAAELVELNMVVDQNSAEGSIIQAVDASHSTKPHLNVVQNDGQINQRIEIPPGEREVNVNNRTLNRWPLKKRGTVILALLVAFIISGGMMGAAHIISTGVYMAAQQKAQAGKPGVTETGRLTQKGKIIYRGPNGGEYYVTDGGNRVYVTNLENIKKSTK